jgi:hypothetical protein
MPRSPFTIEHYSHERVMPSLYDELELVQSRPLMTTDLNYLTIML